jgi:hypothetical protein
MVLIILCNNLDFVSHIYSYGVFSRYFILGKQKILTRVHFQVEDDKMSTFSVRNKAREKFLKLNVMQATNFHLGDSNQNCSIPPDTTPLGIQVAGHSFGDGKNTLGDRTFFSLDLYMLNPCYGIHF